ncbi:putative HTH-type transcriptional regulator [Clostridia bacterium]|nr:putative HTH-type transcriptional regulator [Clostridia bacterium]
MESKSTSPLEDEWAEFRKEICTPEEIAESDLKVALVGEIIKAREKGLTPEDLEDLSGIKKPVINRMKNMNTFPPVNTLLKFLIPLGKTLAVVPIEK